MGALVGLQRRLPPNSERSVEGEEVSTVEKNARREGEAETHLARSLGEVVKTHRIGEEVARSRETTI